MASALTAGATTTEPQYIRVPDSAGARPMHPPARPPGSADRIGRATNTTDTSLGRSDPRGSKFQMTPINYLSVMQGP